MNNSRSREKRDMLAKRGPDPRLDGGSKAGLYKAAGRIRILSIDLKTVVYLNEFLGLERALCLGKRK